MSSIVESRFSDSMIVDTTSRKVYGLKTFKDFLRTIPLNSIVWIKDEEVKRNLKRYACSFSILEANRLPKIRDKIGKELRIYQKQSIFQESRGPDEFEMLEKLRFCSGLDYKINHDMFITREGMCGTPDAIFEDENGLFLGEFKYTQRKVYEGTARSQRTRGIQ